VPVMSLVDPVSKMSKSDPSPKSRILLTDGPDAIVKKVKAAVTDAGSEVAFDWEEKPGISNLLELFSFFSTRSIDDIVSEYADTGYGAFKGAVADAIVEGLAPITRAYESLDLSDVASVMAAGGATARDRAEFEMTTIREAVGLG